MSHPCQNRDKYLSPPFLRPPPDGGLREGTVRITQLGDCLPHFADLALPLWMLFSLVFSLACSLSFCLLPLPCSLYLVVAKAFQAASSSLGILEALQNPHKHTYTHSQTWTDTCATIIRFFFLVVFHVSLLVGRHLCSSDNYQVRFLFILKTKQKHITLSWTDWPLKENLTEKWVIIHRRRKGLAGRPETLLSLWSAKDPLQKKKKLTMVCAWTSVCATLWCGTHTCARSNTKAVLGKKLRLKKNKKRGKKGEILLFFGGSERWRTGEGRGTAHVPERRPFTGAGGEGRKDWLSGLWAVSPAAGWLLAIQS